MCICMYTYSVDIVLCCDMLNSYYTEVARGSACQQDLSRSSHRSTQLSMICTERYRTCPSSHNIS